MSHLCKLLAISGVAICVATASTAQDPTVNGASAFASENAILDTSIPFAIGAREARQSLRGAFGWPTFQEGLVEGVYFRFDPDGYARFAPTPRLDSDVFEVVCRPRTYTCMGRKQQLSMMLNSRNQMQLQLDDVVSGDRFFVTDGLSEIQVPDRILQPLDLQIETLLGTGNELVVRRGEEETARISLKGFTAVAAYLRWIAARQDYTVLPRGWPVPNGGTSDTTLTQSTAWDSPMPQPQRPIDTGPTGAAPVEREVAEVRGELNLLRELLMNREGQANGNTTLPSPTTSHPPIDSASSYPANTEVDMKVSELQRTVDALQDELFRIRGQEGTNVLPAAAMMDPFASGAQPLPTDPLQPMPGALAPAVAQDNMTSAGEGALMAKRLSVLMDELGMDLATAVAVLQMSNGTTLPAPALPPGPAGVVPASTRDTGAVGSTPDTQPLYQDGVVEQILRELEEETLAMANPGAQNPAGTAEEYQLLSRYFRSVAQQ